MNIGAASKESAPSVQLEMRDQTKVLFKKIGRKIQRKNYLVKNNLYV